MVIRIPRGLFGLLACALLSVVPRAEASPFLLNLVASESGGGNGGRSEGTGGAARLGLRPDAWRVPGPVYAATGLGLRLPVKTSADTTLSSAVTSGIRPDLIASLKSTIGASATFGPLTQLDLGHGAYLSVSGPVGDSLVDVLSSAVATPPGVSTDTDLSNSPGLPTTNGGGSQSNVSSPAATQTVVNGVMNTNQADLSSNNPAVHGGSNSASSTVDALQSSPEHDVTNETVRAILADITSGIISSAAENAHRVAGDGVGVTVDEPVHAPEPATLILLASGLALAARQLRRRRT